jgi:hypothetical protein
MRPPYWVSVLTTSEKFEPILMKFDMYIMAPGPITTTYFIHLHIQVQVILRPTVSRPVCPSIWPPPGTREYFFLSTEMIIRHLSLYNMGRPLWQEDGSVIYSYKCYWVLPALSWVQVLQHLRLYFCCLIWDWVPFLTPFTTSMICWRHSNPPPHGVTSSHQSLCLYLYLLTLLRNGSANPQTNIRTTLEKCRESFYEVRLASKESRRIILCRISYSLFDSGPDVAATLHYSVITSGFQLWNVEFLFRCIEHLNIILYTIGHEMYFISHYNLNSKTVLLHQIFCSVY